MIFFWLNDLLDIHAEMLVTMFICTQNFKYFKMIFVNDSGCNVPTAELMQTLASILLAWVIMTLWLWFTLTNFSWDIEKEKSFEQLVLIT